MSSFKLGGALTLFFIMLNMTVKAQFSIEEMRLHDDVILTRSRRQLLFPNVTLLQLNMGVTVPTPEKTIVCNWAFQANFALPWNRTQIPLDILYANSGYDGLSKRETAKSANEIDTKTRKEDENNVAEIYYENDAKLFHFYKYVEEVLNGFGYSGTACITETLCKLGAEPLYSHDEEDLLHELASFILNPNNDSEDSNLPEDHDSRKYIEAYNFGRNNRNCSSYQNCSISIIDMFTNVHDELNV